MDSHVSHRNRITLNLLYWILSQEFPRMQDNNNAYFRRLSRICRGMCFTLKLSILNLTLRLQEMHLKIKYWNKLKSRLNHLSGYSQQLVVLSTNRMCHGRTFCLFFYRFDSVLRSPSNRLRIRLK